ncbi:hypothetical protein GVX76_00765 [[Haemophilus] felis]|nr:hypothetical protein [[Haemophilus] felis]
MSKEIQLLEDILVAEVLILAKTIELEKKQNGGWSSDGYVNDAMNAIVQKRSSILERLHQKQQDQAQRLASSTLAD